METQSVGDEHFVSARIDWPPVSVVMPVRDGARDLRTATKCVLAQDYPGSLEMVIAVAPSTDATEQIARELARLDHRVSVIGNPAATISCGLNAAIREARHEIIVRVDVRGLVPPEHIRRSVEVLAQTGADNVGGVLLARGDTAFGRAVARAMTGFLGIGSRRGRFSVEGSPGPVDTVYPGVFVRSSFEQVGGFDEALDRGEDWDLNFRLRRAGGLIWFDPKLGVGYRPRPTPGSLAEQFFLNGRWRRVLGTSSSGHSQRAVPRGASAHSRTVSQRCRLAGRCYLRPLLAEVGAAGTGSVRRGCSGGFCRRG